MNGWERFIRVVGILTVFLAGPPLFLAVMEWVQVFTPGVGNIDHSQDLVGAFSPVFFTLLLIFIGLGVYQRRAWSQWAWLIIVLLSFPATFVLGYGLFDGGPPYPYPVWLGAAIAIAPIPVAIVLWGLLIKAFRVVGVSSPVKRDTLLLGSLLSLVLLVAVWGWLKDRNTVDLPAEITTYEHQTVGVGTDPYILKAVPVQNIKIHITNMNNVEPLTVSFPSGCQDITAMLINNKNEAVGTAAKKDSESIACTQALTTKVLRPQEQVEQELVLKTTKPKSGWHALRVKYGDFENTIIVRVSGK